MVAIEQQYIATYPVTVGALKTFKSPDYFS